MHKFHHLRHAQMHETNNRFRFEPKIKQELSAFIGFVEMRVASYALLFINNEQKAIGVWCRCRRINPYERITIVYIVLDIGKCAMFTIDALATATPHYHF